MDTGGMRSSPGSHRIEARARCLIRSRWMSIRLFQARNALPSVKEAIRTGERSHGVRTSAPLAVSPGPMGASKPENERERGRTIPTFGTKFARGITFEVTPSARADS
jgi:hypothetical protein